VDPPTARKRPRLARRLERGLKSSTLPLAARLLARAGPPDAGPDPIDGRRLLVVRSDRRLGNLVLLTPFLRRLRQAAPRARIGLLCAESYAPLVAGWPWIDELHVQEQRRQARAPWSLFPWIARVRAARWDLAWVASNPETHSYSHCLLALASGAGERVGFDDPRNRPALTRAVPPPPATLPASLAPLALLRARGLTALACEPVCPLATPPSPFLETWRRREGAGPDSIVVHPGGRGGKAWPGDAWAGLVRRAPAAMRARLLLVGGAEDQELLLRLRAAAGEPPLRLAPGLSVTDLAHLLREASAFIGCDQGVTHLAVALGTPVVALFFQSDPYRYAPLGPRHRTVLLADPRGVDDELWNRPVEGIPRSLLRRATASAARSRAGIPATDGRAVEVVWQALDEVLSLAEPSAHGGRP